ncbi:MAG: hypothetical protein J6V55_03685 [Alistipes sp.]|nr:hypothetical protein [Alistipes sp.]
MVNEVSKLIYNAIVKYHAVYLPDVGTISVVRRPAVIGSKNELTPPRFDIEYSLDNRGKSLIDIISEEVTVDEKRAEEIYSRWLDKAREGSVVSVDRVGTLSNKSFVADSELLNALNISSQPIFIPRKRTLAPLFAVLAIIVVGVICAGGWWINNNKPEVVPVEIIAEETVIPVDETTLTDAVEQPEIEVTPVEEITEVVIADWRENGDIRHWVVVGSYSTTENAERAISDILTRLPESQCDYFKLGSMYAVAVFGSEDIEECQEYKKEHTKDFPQSWVYTPKRFR